VVVELGHRGLSSFRSAVRIEPDLPGRVEGHHDLVADESLPDLLEVALVLLGPGELGLPPGLPPGLYDQAFKLDKTS
jgi:hypothetical protein